MRIVITAILIWAVLLGFFAAGVRVMATSPQQVQGINIVSDTDMVRGDLQRADFDTTNSGAKFIAR